jgi:hypothetical protein
MPTQKRLQSLGKYESARSPGLRTPGLFSTFPQTQIMPLHTELDVQLGAVFYKYFSPTGFAGSGGMDPIEHAAKFLEDEDDNDFEKRLPWTVFVQPPMAKSGL